MSRRLGNLERENYELREAVGSDSEEARERLAADVRSLPPEQDKQAIVSEAARPLPPEELREVATIAVESLPAEQREILISELIPPARETLPFWQFALGVVLSCLPVALDFIAGAEQLVSALPVRLLIPLAFGFWTGLRRLNSLRVWFSVFVSAVVMAGSLLVALLSLLLFEFRGDILEVSLIPSYGEFLAFGITYGLVPGMVVVAGEMFGNALQRRAAYVSTAPAARSHGPSTTGAGGNWSPRTKVLWGAG
jgi:hypothetical protein